MTSNQASTSVNLENEDELEKQIKKLKEEIKASQEVTEKQEARLSQLQLNGFNLANYYFVFQGVILTTLCSGETFLKCSDSWFLATLSGIAAAVNLFGLVLIGVKYIRIYTQQAKYFSNCNWLHLKQMNIRDQQRKLEDKTKDQPQQGKPEVKSKNQPVVNIDRNEIIKLWVCFLLCIVAFLAFAIIVIVNCKIFLCRDREGTKK